MFTAAIQINNFLFHEIVLLATEVFLKLKTFKMCAIVFLFLLCFEPFPLKNLSRFEDRLNKDLHYCVGIP